MKIFTGKVLSTKMNKTAKVAVERFIAHPVYKKRLKKSKKYLVHDELGVKDGQKVKFVASKPYSRHVKWQIIEVVGEKKPVIKKKIKKVEEKDIKEPEKTKKEAVAAAPEDGKKPKKSPKKEKKEE